MSATKSADNCPSSKENNNDNIMLMIITARPMHVRISKQTISLLPYGGNLQGQPGGRRRRRWRRGHSSLQPHPLRAPERRHNNATCDLLHLFLFEHSSSALPVSNSQKSVPKYFYHRKVTVESTFANTLGTHYEHIRHTLYMK